MLKSRPSKELANGHRDLGAEVCVGNEFPGAVDSVNQRVVFGDFPYLEQEGSEAGLGAG